MPPRSQPRHEQLDVDEFIEQSLDALTSIALEGPLMADAQCPRAVFEIYADAMKIRAGGDETAWDLLMKFAQRQKPALIYHALGTDYVDFARFLHRNSDALRTNNIDNEAMSDVVAHATPEILDFLFCEVGIRFPKGFVACEDEDLPTDQPSRFLHDKYGVEGTPENINLRPRRPKRLNFQELGNVWSIFWYIYMMPGWCHCAKSHVERFHPFEQVLYLANVHGYDWTQDSFRLEHAILLMSSATPAFECCEILLSRHPEHQTDPHRVMRAPDDRYRFLYGLDVNVEGTLLSCTETCEVGIARESFAFLR